MINLTHDEESGVDLHGEWEDDKFILQFRINHDDHDDIHISLVLDEYELETLIDYLHTKARKPIC